MVGRYKRATLGNLAALTELARHHLPELGDDGAWRVSALTQVVIGALWSYTQPPASVLAAYKADPSLAALHLNFTAALEEALATLIAGTLSRTGAVPDVRP